MPTSMANVLIVDDDPALMLCLTAVLGSFGYTVSGAADGFSAPYRVAMAFGTALYGFLGLLFAARLARYYVDERWAFLATIAIWWSSSLPVYMYFNPSWSHAHSAFAVALFLWYWHETRDRRTLRQWCILAVVAGLMLNVYYANVTILVVLVVEAVRQYLAAFRKASPGAATLDESGGETPLGDTSSGVSTVIGCVVRSAMAS